MESKCGGRVAGESHQNSTRGELWDLNGREALGQQPQGNWQMKWKLRGGYTLTIFGQTTTTAVFGVSSKIRNPTTCSSEIWPLIQRGNFTGITYTQ